MSDLASPDELLRQLEEFARGGNKEGNSSNAGGDSSHGGGAAADTRANGAAQPMHARPAAIAEGGSAAAAAAAPSTAKPRRLSAAMQPPPSAVLHAPSTAASAAAAAAAAAAPKRSRIRTSSFSKPMQSEREAAAQAERMRQLVLQELNGPPGSASAAAPAAAAPAPAALPTGPKQRPQASYMSPTLSKSNSTSAAMAAVAAAARAAAEEKEQREIEIATAMRANPPRALLANKKRPTDPASPPPAHDPHPAPARRVVASYVDLAQIGQGSGPLPLTLSQCSACLVQVLRVMQASVVDAQAMAELFSILADYLPISPAAANGSPGSPSSAGAGSSSTGVPSLESLIESLQHDQDVLGEAQMLGQSKLLSQMPRDHLAPGGINHERMQRLYRWHLTHVQRKTSAASKAASRAGSTLNTPRAAAPASAAASAAAAASSATIPASASASGAATPSRAPPAIVDFSFASAATPVPRSKPVSRPASGQRSPVAGAGAATAAGAGSAAAAAAAPVSSAAATNAATLWASSNRDDGTSSAGSVTGSGGLSVSGFFGATSRPAHPAAATPIPVRRGRYEDLPSRLLDHFKLQRGGMYSGGFTGAAAGRDTERSSSRTRSRSRSSSRTRGGFSDDLTPRRSPSPSPSPSGASTARAPIPNHALVGTPRSRSRSAAVTTQQAPADYWSVNPAGVHESTLLRSTAKTPLRSSFTSSISAAHAPSVMSTHSRGLLLAAGARAHPDPYVNKPSIVPPSLGVGQFSQVQNKMQIPVRESYSRAQQPYPPVSSPEDEQYSQQDSYDDDEYAATAAASGSDPSPDAFDASPTSDPSYSADPPAHSNDFDSAAPAAAGGAVSGGVSGSGSGGDITLPENLNAMVAEIESMNSNLEELLAREAAQDYEQSQRTARILAQRRTNGARASSLTRSSRPRSSSRESIRDQTLRRPRTVFPGSAALYADDPEKLEALEAAAHRRSRSRTRRGVDPAAPLHVYSPSPRRGNRPLSPNPHAYQAPARSSSGVRTAGPPPVPQQRDASYLPYETNLRHRQLSESLSSTLDGLPSPTSRRRVAPTSPPRSPRSGRSHSSASSRATTPRGGGGALGSVPLKKLETVPQARHMGYLSPAANAELFRQSSTYATVIAGGSSGGSAQLPISYVRSRSPQRDRSIVDKLKYPQQRPMSYLAPEVNTRFVADARSWEKKIAGSYEAPVVGGLPPFKYDPATDPALKRPVARTITTQARPMGFLEPSVNAAYLRAAELQEARVAAGGPNGARPAQQQQHSRAPANRAGSAVNRAGSAVRAKSAVGSNLAASMEEAVSDSGSASGSGSGSGRDEPAHSSEPVVERTPLRGATAVHQQPPQYSQQHQHRDSQQQRAISHAASQPPQQQREVPDRNRDRDRDRDREWERDRLRAQQAEQDRQQAAMEEEEAEQRRMDAEMWDEQQQRREQEQQEAEEAAWAVEAASSSSAAAAPAPVSLDTSPSRGFDDDDRDSSFDPALASPSTRKRMSDQTAARHAAQQAAFEETERQWSQQRTPGGSRKQQPRTLLQQQQHQQQHQDRSYAPHPHAHAHAHAPMPQLRYDDDDDDDPHRSAAAASSHYGHYAHATEDAPVAAAFMAAAAAAAAAGADDNGADSEADMYYKYLRTRSVGSSSAEDQQQQQANNNAYAHARDEYDPLAAEQATLAHSQPASARRTPQTLRPSKRQP